MDLEVKVSEVEVVESMLTISYWNIISIYVHCYLRQELFTSQWSDVDQAHFFRFSLGLHQCYVSHSGSLLQYHCNSGPSNTFYQNHHNVGTSSPLFAVKSFCYQAAELMSTKRQSLDFQLGRKQFFLPLFLCLSFLCRKTPVHSFRCRAGIGGKAQGGQGGGGGGVLVSLSQHLTDLLNSLSWDTSMIFPL